MTLTQELADALAASKDRIPEDVRAIMADATDRIAGTGLVGGAVKTGDRAPDFTLPGAAGQPVSLSARLAAGPVVLLFYRGAWCPYCNIELRAYQHALGRIADLGASLIAVTPETPDNSLSTVAKHNLAFDVVSDVGQGTIADYGLLFDLPDPLVTVYRDFSIDLPKSNGENAWRLPVAAGYVIAADGTVRLHHVDVDYTKRLDPEDAIRALEALRG